MLAALPNLIGAVLKYGPSVLSAAYDVWKAIDALEQPEEQHAHCKALAHIMLNPVADKAFVRSRLKELRCRIDEQS